MDAQIKVGDVFPAFAPAGVVSIVGGELPETAGQVVLVDFWASWCAPCKASFPAFAQLHAAYSGQGLKIVAVSVDEKPAAALAFWKKMNPPFIGLHDRGQNLVRQVVVPVMPTSYLVGRDGKVRFINEGFHGDASGRGGFRPLREQIEAALAEK